MIGAHASYVQGAVSEAIGNVTGSADWQKSGQSVKESAVEDMRAASAVDKSQPPAENPTFGGKVEAALGNAVGCEGMGAFASFVPPLAPGLRPDLALSRLQRAERPAFRPSLRAALHARVL